MKKYKKEFETLEDSEGFIDEIKRLIEKESGSGTRGYVAKHMGISTTVLGQRQSEAYEIMSENGKKIERIKFKVASKKEKTNEYEMKPEIREDGSFTLEITKNIAKYLELEESELIVIKINNKDSTEYKKTIEICGYKAFIANKERKRQASRLSKVKNKEKSK